MSRMTPFSNPLMLGFEAMEKTLERVAKSGDGYPPYNIERIRSQDGEFERLRITLAVAGFKRHQIEITVEENQLIIRGRQEDDKSRQYVHRGIATRQFSRTFVLADSIEVKAADLTDGLLSIDLVKIDVEGSEQEVLRGIAPGDWPKIRQLVVEVHDLDGRAAELAAMLRGRGYRVTVAQTGWAVHAVFGVVMLYAVRDS